VVVEVEETLMLLLLLLLVVVEEVDKPLIVVMDLVEQELDGVEVEVEVMLLETKVDPPIVDLEVLEHL
jgi:hypothetical protein